MSAANGTTKLSPIPPHLNKSKIITDQSSGYSSATFEGKEAQLESVMDEIDRQGFIPENLIENETKVCIHIYILQEREEQTNKL